VVGASLAAPAVLGEVLGRRLELLGDVCLSGCYIPLEGVTLDLALENHSRCANMECLTVN
jgi:hypothetical protein